MTDGEDSSSSLMKMVEAIAISPQDARVVAQQYESQARQSRPNSLARFIHRRSPDWLAGVA